MNCSAQAFRCHRRINWPAPPIQHHDEFIATETRQEVAFANRSRQATRHLAQQVIAERVTETVVHHLEVIKIDKQQPDRTRLRARQSLLQHLHEVRTISQAGQLVVTSSMGQLLS